MLDFKPLVLAMHDGYEEKRKYCSVKSADYTFTNLWGWADKYGLSLAFTGDFAFISQKMPYRCIWAPVGDWDRLTKDVLDGLLESAAKDTDGENPPLLSGCSNKTEIYMHRVPDVLAEKIAGLYGDKVSVQEAPGQWEYLYSQKELASLSGNRFHKKKNHVNTFHKTYSFEQVMLTPQTGVKGSLEDVLLLQNEWCQWHDCQNSDSLYAENDAVFRVIGSWERLGTLFGNCFYIDNKMAAFAVGEKLDENSCVVHFEKAHTAYKGIYQAINHAFVNSCAEGLEIVNREQDMDEEGIRKAKQSYNPIGFLKKSTLVFNI